MTILENVPSALRAPILVGDDVATVISNVVSNNADGLSIDDQINFIVGAIRHQKRVSINKDGQPLPADKSNSFKAVIEKVEIFDRRGDGNFLVGKKAKIHLKAKNDRGELEDQSIDTEWVEYNAFHPEDEIFGMALANTLVNIAKENIGKDVFVSKGFITGVKTAKGGSSVRFCANIQPVTSHGEDKSTGSSSGTSSKTPLTSKDEVEDFIADIKDDKDANALFNALTEKQQGEIPRIILSGLAAGNSTAYLAKAVENLDLDIKKSEIEEIIDGKSKEKDFDLFFLFAEVASE